eukprot:2918008-Rhodomonas_salina.1
MQTAVNRAQRVCVANGFWTCEAVLILVEGVCVRERASAMAVRRVRAERETPLVACARELSAVGCKTDQDHDSTCPEQLGKAMIPLARNRLDAFAHAFAGFTGWLSYGTWLICPLIIARSLFLSLPTSCARPLSHTTIPLSSSILCSLSLS